MQAILVLGVIIALIIFSFFSKFNIGSPAVLASLLLGRVLLGMGAAQTAGFIPTGTILTLIALSVFYGFALENGTADVVIQRILYRFGRRSDWMPLLIFTTSALLSAAGLGCGNATLIMAPIAMSLVSSTSTSPLIMAVAVSCGSAAGGNFPFSYGGMVASDLIENAAYLKNATPLIFDSAMHNLVINLVAFLVLYVFCRREKTSIKVKEHVSFNRIQRNTFRLTCGTMFCSITPCTLSLIIPCKFTEQLADIFDISTVLIVGIIIAQAMHLAPEREILRKHVPWMLLIVISGMSMLIGIARECGILELLSQIYTESVPDGFRQYLVMIVSMVMSLFAGAISVVIPTMYPLVPAIASSASEMSLMYGMILVGATCGGISPYSSGGMILLGAYPDNHKRRKLLLQLLIMPFYLTLIACLIYAIW